MPDEIVPTAGVVKRAGQIGVEPAPRLVTRRFALATSANLVFFIAVTSFFTLPVHLEALGGSRAEIGRVMGSFGIAALIGIPLTGSLADRHGRRRFMAAGALLWALLSLGFIAVGSLGPLVYVLRLGQGLAFSLCFVATNAVIVDLAPPGGLGRAIALFGATTLVSHAVGPSLGEWVARHFGFRALFELSAAFAAAAAALLVFVPDVARAPPEHGRADLGMLAIALRRGARGSLLAALGTAVTFGAAINFMPVFVRSRGLASHAPFFVAYVAAAILVRVSAGGLGDRAGHRRVAALAALGFALSGAGFALVHSTLVLVLFAFAFGISHGFAYPSMNALFVEGAPPSARGRAMALFNLAFNIGVTLSAFVAGEIAERYDYSTLWLAVAFAAVAGGSALVWDRPARASV